MKTIPKVLIIIILLGTLIRMINLNQPLLEGASTRQVQTAMIARNFYNLRFKLFYPQVDGFGENPAYLMQEFYIIPFIAALFYKLLGGVHDWILRLLSVFSYIIATSMIYKLASYYFNKKIGIISAFCFTVSPLSIYLGRAVHPEMTMIFFNMSAIYFFSRWIDESKLRYGFWAALSFIFAVLLKIPNLYLLLPLAFIAYTKFGFDLFKVRKLWAILIISGIPIILFNYHQHLVRTAFPNPDMVNFKLEVILDSIKVYLRGKEFYKATYENLISYTLTPIGFTLFILGSALKVERKRDLLFHVWILSAAIFFLIMPGQSWQGYYQIHLLPAACIFIGKLVRQFYESQFCSEHFFKRQIYGVLFLLLVLLVVFRYSYAYYKVPENFRHVVKAGKAVDRLTEKDALVICSIENGLDLVYYSNRRGWPFTIDMEAKRQQNEAEGVDVSNRIYDPIEILEQLRKEGAAYFVSASVEKEFLRNKEFSSYMFRNYRAITKNSEFIIFDLKRKNSLGLF